jgi:hypothetical protein
MMGSVRLAVWRCPGRVTRCRREAIASAGNTTNGFHIPIPL